VQKLRECRDVLERFWDAALSLREKLGAILFQLPPYFRKDIAVLKDFLGALPPGMKGAFEFRHGSWFDDEVFAALRANRTALCIADSEKMTAPLVTTAEHSYLRLRHAGYTPLTSSDGRQSFVNNTSSSRTCTSNTKRAASARSSRNRYLSLLDEIRRNFFGSTARENTTRP
jgi:uncharacterized protein YecE (DUF72 family)